LALEGMSIILKLYKPMMMIEITENHATVSSMLKDLGYKLFNDKRMEVFNNNFHSGNTFCLHGEKHLQTIKSLDFKRVTNIKGI
jgi:hypothetical protein